MVWGEYTAHAHKSALNIFNGVLMCVAALPSILLVRALNAAAATDPTTSPLLLTMDAPLGVPLDAVPDLLYGLTSWEGLLKAHMASPILFANVLFFVNVVVGFWVVG